MTTETETTLYRYYEATNTEAAFHGTSAQPARFYDRAEAEEYSRTNWPHREPRIVTGLTEDPNTIR